MDDIHREELDLSGQQHRAVIAMQVLNCTGLDPETDRRHKVLKDLAVKTLVEYLRTKKDHDR